MMRNIVVLELTVILVFLSSATSLLFCQGKAFSEHPTRASQDTTFAAEYFAKGKALYEAAKYDSSIFYYEKAKIIFEELAGRYGSNALWEKTLQCYNHIGTHLTTQGKYEQAMLQLNQALDLGLQRIQRRQRDRAG